MFQGFSNAPAVRFARCFVSVSRLEPLRARTLRALLTAFLASGNRKAVSRRFVCPRSCEFSFSAVPRKFQKSPRFANPRRRKNFAKIQISQKTKFLVSKNFRTRQKSELRKFPRSPKFKTRQFSELRQKPNLH